MKIGLFIGSLGGGGAERVLLRLAAHWSTAGHDVVVITLSDGSDDAYPVPSGVRRVPLGMIGRANGLLEAIRLTVQRIAHLRQAFVRERPDVLVSFLLEANVLAALGAWGVGSRVIVCERVDPHYPIRGRWRLLRWCTYRLANALVVQTATVVPWASSLVGSSRTFVIPNPVVPPATPIVLARDSKTILAAGRLRRQKGFDLLIDAFASLPADLAEWRLLIIGEGPERQALLQQIARLDLQDRVSLPGWVQDTQARYAQAAMFVLSSRWEGFPNALAEAMAVGLPVISFDCPSGPGDLVQDGVNGVLVRPGDSTALRLAMERLMRDAEGRRALGERAQRVVDLFSMERVMGLWDRILSTT